VVAGNMFAHRASAALIVALAVFRVEAALGQTGDPVVDQWITSYYAHRAGNNLAPTSLTPSNYPNVLACSTSTPVWENNCPSDLTYTPNANTGGYQAFGVGINSWPSQSYWDYDCTLEDVWVWDPELQQWVLEWQVLCYYQLVQVSAQAGGQAVSRVRWGSQQHAVQGSMRTISTLAFNGEDLAGCHPSWNGSDAPCTATGTFVEGGGYEDKIVIPEFCPLSRRTGTFMDANSGCFYSYNGLWVSNLPSPYLDTTAGDGPSNYVAAIGVASGVSIVENFTYTSRITFFQWGQETVNGNQIRHNGSVTVRLPFTSPCLLYAPVFGLDAACFFNVDQTQIAPPSTLSN